MNTWLLLYPTTKAHVPLQILHVNSFKYTIFKRRLYRASAKKKGAFHLCFEQKTYFIKLTMLVFCLQRKKTQSPQLVKLNLQLPYNLKA